MTQTTWTDEDRASWRQACTLESMRGWWKGSDCVVVAAGVSARATQGCDPHWGGTYHDRWTIGCNRAASFCAPDFAACFEPRKDRSVWYTVLASYSVPFVLSHIPRDHPRTVVTGDKVDVRPWINPQSDYFRTEANCPGYAWGHSTFWAVACAIVLGFETVGIIGLDMTGEKYPLHKVQGISRTYTLLLKIAQDQGCRLINLNPESLMEAIPIGTWSEVRRK